jgi:hypothetical protein
MGQAMAHQANAAFPKFDDLNKTHEHEEQLRRRSLAMISADQALSHRLATIQRAMAVIAGFTIDHKATSDSQATVQLIGIRLFNAAASGVTLALSGYYQPAFHQARDILETGFLLDLFRTAPDKISLWEKSNRGERRKQFDPVAVRRFLDDRDGDTSRKREVEYRKLSELASHLTPHGFRLTTRGQFAEFGPFLDELRMQAWLHEMVLRFGPAAVMYANHFLDAEPRLILSFQEFGTDLTRTYHRSTNSGMEEP